MARITITLSSKQDKITRKSPLLFRFVGGRDFIFRVKSGLYIAPNRWNADKEEAIEPRLDTPEKKEIVRLNKQLTSLKSTIIEAFTHADKSTVDKAWLEQIVDAFHHPQKYSEKRKEGFFEVFDEFLEKRKLSDVRKKNFKVIRRALQRYELYIRTTVDSDYSLTLDDVKLDTLQDLEKFLKHEHLLCQEERYKPIYEAIPETRTPQPRGQNTINDIFTKLRTLFLWAIDTGKTTNNPFKHFVVEECVYGTPYYITVEERNKLYRTNLSRHPHLAIQRDIFVFQCLIGCRVSDLYRMTCNNVIDGAIEYIARKTKEGRPVTVRVPLNAIAKEILEKYADYKGATLFPFISKQKYNVAIKRAFLAARLRRPVTVVNPVTREQEVKPLNELASSHLARRCFVGNLYKQVKDPNLVGVLSGHKEGSKAFARYRTIDEQMKTELVKMLE
ncbi:phage integrase SAM-like domain-containing protein [Alistipes sp.]|uniref:phage integrase SAM-like domain-containing protein n=1 Tax=Alistipes sp. TaxID=1872444 RepID=UPI003AB3380C